MKSYEEMSKDELIQVLKIKEIQVLDTFRRNEECCSDLIACIDLAYHRSEIICDDTGTPYDYRYLDTNQSYDRETGRKSADIKGKTVLELFPDIEKSWIEIYGKVALTGESIRFVNYNHNTGRYYDVFAFRPAKGQFAAMGKDVTAQKQIEKDVIRYQEDLKQANELLEQNVAERTLSLEKALGEQESFSYSVSHDLRAPLRHINSYVTILSEDFGDLLPPKAHRLIDRTRAASRRMGNLIDDILELARVSRTHLTKKSINLSELATHVCNSLKEAEPHRNVELIISDSIRAQGDKPLLMQLMVNLLGNAWKYTSKNPAARIEFGKVVEADQKIFYVRDNGVGFDMQYSDKLFGEFQRLHGSEFEGNGIGLATVKRIVDRHRGRIWAESKLGEGATFYFTL
jgi:signal transduction histidine kinase